MSAENVHTICATIFGVAFLIVGGAVVLKRGWPWD